MTACSTVCSVALLILAANLAAAAATLLPAQDTPDPRIEAIDRKLQEAEEQGFSGTILIRSQNRVLLHRAFGFRDREEKDPMTTAHGYDIGSLVKPITAVAILKLEEQGLLETSDRLVEYFPNAPDDKRNITVMQMLTHTAGMDDVFGGDYDVVSREWLVDTALTAPLIAEPGQREEYSNSAYSLLAVIIEKVTGEAYEQFVRRAVLEPAGAGRIGYVLPGWTSEELAVGHRTNWSRFGTPLDQPWAADGPSWNLRGNGGMLAAPEHMARWYEALYDGKIIGSEALDKYLDFDAGESRSVGGKALAHAGGNGIFNTLQISFIDHDFHMTFFTNTAAFEAERLWRSFRDELIALARDAGRGR